MDARVKSRSIGFKEIGEHGTGEIPTSWTVQEVSIYNWISEEVSGQWILEIDLPPEVNLGRMQGGKKKEEGKRKKKPGGTIDREQPRLSHKWHQGS